MQSALLVIILPMILDFPVPNLEKLAFTFPTLLLFTQHEILVLS